MSIQFQTKDERFSLDALREQLGIWGPPVDPTPEEIERRRLRRLDELKRYEDFDARTLSVMSSLDPFAVYALGAGTLHFDIASGGGISAVYQREAERTQARRAASTTKTNETDGEPS